MLHFNSLFVVFGECHGEEDMIKQGEIREARWEAEVESLDRYSLWSHGFQPGRLGDRKSVV